MTFRKLYTSYILSYLPGAIVLVFSMLALHLSLLLIEEYARLLEEYTRILQVQNFSTSFDHHFFARKTGLYWSVIALGFSGFVLVLLNSDKLRRLKWAEGERKSMQKVSQQRLAAMESTLDGIGIVDANGALVYMNRALMDLYRIDNGSGDQLIGQNWEFLYSKDGQDKAKKEALDDLEEAGYWQGVSTIPRQDGTVISAELSLTRLPDGGLIATARDITDKLEADRQKEELQGQFFQAQKMEAIGRLTGGVAHDFNNILAAMNGYAEFLIDDLDESSPQYSFAKNILQAGKQARNLVDQLLAFSRLGSKESKHFDLIVPVHETLSMLQASFPKTIEVTADIQVISAPIDGNATQISQLIMNLCVNARDAMEEQDKDKGTLAIGIHSMDASTYEDLSFIKDSFPEPGKTPMIRIEDVEPGQTRLFLGNLVHGQAYIILSVRDNGSGMSRVIMEHIFEPFFTTKPVDKGTGLGLATVHGVVASHKGAMIIDSTIGKGTIFELFFPVSSGLVFTESPEVEDTQVGEGAHIHLVEDQEEVRDMMMTMLQRLGYEVTCTTTGLEALKYLKEAGGDVDLVITDYNMPKMTGLEMIIQVHMSQPDLPFILLSGYSEQKLQDLMKEHSAIKAILRKPVSRKILAQKIEAVLFAQREEKRVA